MPDQIAPQPSKSRWRGIPGYNYLAHLTKAVVEARVPVIAVILLGVIMLIPSQSAEALRIFAENTVSEKTRFFLFWGGFGLWLIVTTFCALYVAFSRYTKAQKQTLFCNAHRVVYGFALVGPILINGFALQHSGAFPGIGRLMIWASVAIMIGIAAFGWRKHVSADQQVPPERSVATGLWVIIFVLSVIAATIGLFSILLAAAFIFVWSIIGWWWFKQSHMPMNSQDTPRQPKGFWITIVVLLVIFTVSALVAIICPPPAPIYLTLSATFVLSLLTAIYLAGRLIGVAAIAVCFVWLIAMDFWDWNDNHQVRTIPVARNDQKPQEVSAALDEWLRLRCVRSDHKQQLPETCGTNSAEANRKDGYTIVIVAAEGGGMRAAYFTDLVLQELRSRSHARSGDFDKHLFLIVGVSGGSVGAASYAAALYKGKPPSDEAATSGDVTALEADFLSPIISALVPGDFFARFWPFTDLSRLDRARSLEDAFSNALAKPLGISLHDIKFQEVYRPDPTHPVPALMLMTTDVATGHRMAVSHLTMPDPPAMNYVNGCRRRGDVADTGHVKNLTPRLWTFSEEVENEDLPLDTAAILSAGFRWSVRPARCLLVAHLPGATWTADILKTPA